MATTNPIADLAQQVAILSTTNAALVDAANNAVDSAEASADAAAASAASIAGGPVASWATLTGAITAAAAKTAINLPADTNASLALKADLASPALTGNPTAPTQSNTDDSTRIATTAWARLAMQNIASAAGFAVNLNPTGYIKFPSWLGGVIIQWGTTVATTNGASAYSFTYPIAFPNGVWTAVVTNGDSGAQLGSPLISSGGMGGSAMTVVWSNGSGGVGSGISTRTNWIVLGY